MTSGLMSSARSVVKASHAVLVEVDRGGGLRVAGEVARERAGEGGELVDEAAVVVEQAEDALQLLDGLGRLRLGDVLDVVRALGDAVGGDDVAQVLDLGHAEVALA